MFLRRFILIATIALMPAPALAAGAAKPPAPARPPTPAAPAAKDSITFVLPQGWSSSTDRKDNALISANSASVDKDSTGQTQASIVVVKNPGTKIDVADQEKSLARGNEWVQQYKVVEQATDVTIAGQKGVYFGGVFKRGTLELRSRQYMVVLNNQIYTITFTCLASEWAKYESAIEASLATFSVKH